MQQQLAEENIMERVRAIASTTPHWTVFFQHVFGLNGIVRTHLPDINDRKRFYTTPNFKLILGAMQDLRSRKLSCQQEETTRVITVRLPKSMHEQLVEEAHEERTSLNKLCLTKLLEPVESEHVPLTINPPSKRNRDTRPAPQPLNRPRESQHGVPTFGVNGTEPKPANNDEGSVSPKRHRPDRSIHQATAACSH